MSNIADFQVPRATGNLGPKRVNVGHPEADSQLSDTAENELMFDTYPPIYSKPWVDREVRSSNGTPSYPPIMDTGWGEPSFGFDTANFVNSTYQTNDNENQVVNSVNQTDYHENQMVNSVYQNIAQDNDPLGNEIINQLKAIGPIFDQTDTIQDNHSTMHSNNEVNAPKTDADNQYRYNSVEEALDYWISQLSVNEITKVTYKRRVIKLIHILDKEGITRPPQSIISDYINIYLKDQKSIRDTKDIRNVAKRFFAWLNEETTQKQIRPKRRVGNNQDNDEGEIKLKIPEPKIKPQTNIIKTELSKAFNEWTKTLKGNANTITSYKMNILSFIMLLTQLKTLNPTLDNVSTYINKRAKCKSKEAVDEYKKSVKSFLKFLEKKGNKQNPKIYKYLNI